MNSSENQKTSIFSYLGRCCVGKDQNLSKHIDKLDYNLNIKIDKSAYTQNDTVTLLAEIVID